MEQRQDEQAAVGGSQVQCRRHHADHRGEIGVVEHHPLGLAGRAARIDEQGQRLRCSLDDGDADRRRRERCHVDHGHASDVERGALVEDQPGAGVLDLERGLAGRQARVDRRERGADPPRREHDDDQLDAVRQHRRCHVAQGRPRRHGGSSPWPRRVRGTRCWSVRADRHRCTPRSGRARRAGRGGLPTSS